MHKTSLWPLFTKVHKHKCLQWPRNTWGLILTQACLLMSDCRWSGGWLVDRHHVPPRLQHQQGKVMFCQIMCRELVDPFQVDEGVKITSVKSLECLSDHFLPWCQTQNCPFCNKIIFRTKHHLLLLEQLCITGCSWYERRHTREVAPALPWPQPYRERSSQHSTEPLV